MAERVQVILKPEEKLRLQQQAEREGSSLSAWLRQVALERLAQSEASGRFGSVTELRELFARCQELEQGQEPDWELQKRLIEESRRSGASRT